MTKKVLFLISILVIIIALAGFAYVTAKTDMGPKDIKIKKWRLHLSMAIFKVDNPGQGIIKVSKKVRDKEIQRGFILFNKRVLRLKEFLTGKGRVFQKKVGLRSTNLMVVFLQGTPGASLKVNVKRGVNSRPVAENDKATTPMNRAVSINVLANDKDIDRDSLKIAGFTKPSHGDILEKGLGTLKYTPAPGFEEETPLPIQ